MNPGIRPLPTQFADMPNGLLGAPTPVSMTYPSRYWHPEAIDWLERVVSNGGSVSGSTLAAVSDFCNAIDTAGIRSAMYRLNLFAGNGLLSCLVPLYRAPSLTARPIGASVDININFVSSDYTETAGLKANTTKLLDLGVSTLALPSLFNSHLSFSGVEMEAGATGVFRTYIGNGGTAQAACFFLLNNQASNRYPGIGTFNGVSFGFNATEAHMVGSRTSSNLVASYRSGVSLGTNPTVAGDVRVADRIFVMNGCTCTGRMYSFGTGLAASQVASFSAAVIAFNRAIGR